MDIVKVSSGSWGKQGVSSTSHWCDEKGDTGMAKLPLEGIRVVELGVVWAGPYVGRLLADWGAEVIRVESCQHFQFHTRGYIPRMPELLVERGIGYSAYKNDSLFRIRQ